jgi:hypothetical protein
MKPLVPAAEATAVFRASRRSYLITAVFTGFFLMMGVILRRESAGAWPVLAVAGAVAALLFADLAYRRFEVNPIGLRYRDLRTNRVMGFGNIERARFETTVNRAAPHGVAVFWIHPRDGDPLRIDLRAFPRQGAAELLAALERHHIPIEGADTIAARRLLFDVRGGDGPRRGEGPRPER